MAVHRTWVAFLRGMNLGGRRLTNEALRAAVEACGCRDVRTFQASGNVILVDDRAETRLRSALEDGLAEGLGYPVTVFVRGSDDLVALAGSSPFTPAQLKASAGKPQVVFVQHEVTPALMREIDAIVPEGDVVAAAVGAVHWLPATGLADSTLDFRRLDAITGGTTVRTLGTVERLCAKFL